MRPLQTHERAFTLIELLVVVAIIAILVGLLFPAFKAVQNQARQTQAKNDLTQIVNAVNAFYTEYGKYPLCSGVTTDTIYGPSGGTSNSDLFYSLRAVAAGCNSLVNGVPAVNPRQIVYISPPTVKNPTSPRSGIATQAATVNCFAAAIGDFVDPWGTPYNVEIDGDYNNQITTNPYSDPSPGPPGGSPLSNGVIAWSLGLDGVLGTKTAACTGNNIYTNSDDVISWQ